MIKPDANDNEIESGSKNKIGPIRKKQIGSDMVGFSCFFPKISCIV